MYACSLGIVIGICRLGSGIYGFLHVGVSRVFVGG